MQRKWRRRWEQKKTGFSTHSVSSISSSVIKAAAKCVLPPLVAAGILLSTAGPAFALPTDVVIVNGTATITQTNDTMNVNQGSRKLIVNSDTFVINANETLNLNQGLQDVALWKVTGGDPSAIYGNVNANGGLFLINESGTLFSKGSQVNVGSLVTSSLNIADSDFLAGNYKFSGKDNSGAVVNQGTITAKNGGYIALMGPQVKNEGILVARQGTVALGAGNAVTLDMHGDGLLNLAVDAAAVNASVTNHQLIQADGGQVIMTGRAAKDLAGTVVNNSGIIQARSIENKNGVIRLDGGATGTVVNSGVLDASGKAAGQTGGTVKVLGENVELHNGTSIDVSGANGGGTALIGGNYQGKGPEQNAKNTTVEKGATITADALEKGNGGMVVVWANDTTQFNGTISARGGANGGDGGQVETSGHKTLELGDAARVVTLASKGKTGSWLLDPEDFTIGTGATGANYWNHIELGNALNSSDITVKTAESGSGNGDINVNARIDWSSPTTLTLSAYRDININDYIIGTGGGNLTLRADNTGLGNGGNDPSNPGLGAGHGMVNVFETDYANGDYAISLTGGDGTGNNIMIYYNPIDGFNINGKEDAVNPTNSFYLILQGPKYDQSFYWVNPWITGTVETVNRTKIYTPIPKLQGNIAAYMLVNTLTDLQSINNNTSGIYALGRNIDASATRNWTGGFQSIGLYGGILDGLGHTIDDLYVDSANAGPFSSIYQGTVRNLGLTNVDIRGRRGKYGNGKAGGLAATATGATIDNVYVTGKVTAEGADAGGLLGYAGNNTFITNSYSTADVSVSGSFELGPLKAGGLIGQMDGGTSVKNSYSTGAVSGEFTGLPGISEAGFYLGGLVGNIGENPVNGYTTGGTIEQAYSTGAVTLNTKGSKTVTAYVGGLVGGNAGGRISRSYSSGRVSVDTMSDTIYAGGFAGSNRMGYQSVAGVITDSYWDKERSGQSQGIGADSGTTTSLTGLTTAQMTAQSSFKDWDFTKDWFMLDGYTTPFLRSEYSTNITNAHQLQLMAMDPTAHYTLAADLDLRGYDMAPGVGFVPIDNFSGSLDGQGHTVSWLTIHDYGAADAIGLFGRTENGASIHDVALANANVRGSAGNDYVGILAGDNAGSISNVFTGGTVSGEGNVGGIAGLSSGTIATSFSAAKVSGDGSLGGLVGGNSGDISESYLDDSGSVGGSTGGPLVGSNSGTVLDPTYSGANWVNLGGNHYLAWTVAPDGTIGLYTPAQLQAIQNYLSGSYRLRSDLDLAGLNWTAIGTAADAFTGKLNGGSYTIDNLTIANSGLEAIGLFGYTQGAELSNLTLNNVNIAGVTGNTYVGGLAGYADGGSITNVSVGGTVTADGDGSYVGGMAGYSTGALSGSRNAAAVTGGGANSHAGGLTGYNAGSIVDSYNTGTVTTEGAGSYAGGVTGENAGVIGDSTSTVHNGGAVTAKGVGSYAGGITGRNTGIIGVSTNTYGQGTVYNEGAVTTEGTGSYAGGVAGENTGTIAQAYNAAVVTTRGAGSYAGGLAGLNAASGSIDNAYFGLTNGLTKVVSNGEDSYVGGLAGQNDGNISNAYSFGAVDSSGAGSKVGGLVGANSGSITAAYVFGAVQASGTGSKVGGLIGDNAAGAIVDHAVWNPATTGQSKGVGAGQAAGTDLTTEQMIYLQNWSGWDFSDGSGWKVNSASGNMPNYFPYLKWQYGANDQPYFRFGRVVDGGLGVGVGVFIRASQPFPANDYDEAITTETIGADGFYYLVGNQADGTPEKHQNSPGLYFVTGESYQANTLTTALSHDLYKNTLHISLDPTTYDTFFNNQNLFGLTQRWIGQYSNLPVTMFSLTRALGKESDPNSWQYDFAVRGDLWMKNVDWSSLYGGTISATGGMLLDNSAMILEGDHSDVRMLYTTFDPYESLEYHGQQQLVAGGDITIKESGRFIIQENHLPGGGPRLQAGGNITIDADGGFINWGGSEALQAGGRTLVYAPDMMITSADKYTFYETRVTNNGDYTKRSVYGSLSDKLLYDTRGGLPVDFVLWDYQDGDAVPDSGSGFIYTEAEPRTEPRPWAAPFYPAEPAAGTAQAANAAWPGMAVDGATPDVRASIMEATIVDGGVALPDDADDENGEE